MYHRYKNRCIYYLCPFFMFFCVSFLCIFSIFSSRVKSYSNAKIFCLVYLFIKLYVLRFSKIKFRHFHLITIYIIVLVFIFYEFCHYVCCICVSFLGTFVNLYSYLGNLCFWQEDWTIGQWWFWTCSCWQNGTGWI